MFKKAYQQQLLSWHCLNIKKTQNNDKLNLFGKAITTIDMIQRKSQLKLDTIKEIDLSHNAITTIQNIHQFQNLEILNISHNKISSYESIIKLGLLKKIRKVMMKGNPVFKQKVPNQCMPLLLSIQTDIQLINEDVKTILNEIIQKKQQIVHYGNYLIKLQLHIDIISRYQFQTSYDQNSIFPKIKKILQHQIYHQSDLKRQFVSNIQAQYFSLQKKLIQYLKNALKQIDQNRSELIRKIYDKQELLLNLRSVYQEKVGSKKALQKKNMTNFYIKSDSPETSKCLRQNNKNLALIPSSQKSKVQSLLHKKSKMQQNSPSKLSSQFLKTKQNQYFQQNFINMLIKLNPAYHLLHSPLISLKSNEKDLLIKNLTAHLKDKMKELLKYQKSQIQFTNIKIQNQELKVHLQNLTSEYKVEYSKSLEKLKALSKLHQSSEEIIEKLCQQNENYQKQIVILREQIQKFETITKQSALKIQQNQNQIQVQQKIKQKHQKILKSQYLTLLTHKAKHFKLLHTAKKNNKQQQNYQLLHSTFDYLKQETMISKKQKKLTHFLKLTRFRQLYKYIKGQLLNIDKIKNFRIFIKLKQSKNLCLLLRRNYKVAQHKQYIKMKISSQINTRLKKQVFNLLKQLIDDKNQEQYCFKVAQYQDQLKIKRYFNCWKKVIKQKQIKNEINIKTLITMIKRRSLSYFVQMQQSQIQFKIHQMALSEYLSQLRKIKSYHSLSKIINATILKRTIKINKILMIIRHKYLFLFSQTMRDKVVKNRCKRLREKELKKRGEDKIRQDIKASKQHKNKIIIKFNTIIAHLNRKLKVMILRRQQNMFDLQRRTSQRQKRQFINILRNQYIQTLKITNKITLLKKSSIFALKLKHFYANLTSLTKSRQQSRYYDLLKKAKSFNRWKSLISNIKIHTIKQNYLKYQTQIIQLSQMNKNYLIQKQDLLQQLQRQSQTIQQYKKTCEEFQFLLESKQVKYQKLKEIYQEVACQGKHQELTYRHRQESKNFDIDRQKKFKKSQQQSSIRNKYGQEVTKFITKSQNNPYSQIYLKYLPQNINNQDQHFTFKNQHNLDNHYYQHQLKKIREKQPQVNALKQTQRKKPMNNKAEESKYSYSYKYF